MSKVQVDFRIVASRVAPHHLARLRELFETEWGRVDPFEGMHVDVVVPQPILALDNAGSLVGGLSFTNHAAPGSDDIGVWINAVYVARRSAEWGWPVL